MTQNVEDANSNPKSRRGRHDRTELASKRLVAPSPSPILAPYTGPTRPKFLPREANDLKVIITQIARGSHRLRSIPTCDQGRPIPNLELHFAGAQPRELELVEPLDKREFAQLLVSIVDDGDEICLALGYQYDTADSVLGVLDATRLGKVVVAAVGADGKRVVPERALDVFAVRGDHVCRRSVLVLPRFDEGAEDLLVPGVAVAVYLSLDCCRICHGLGPEVAHVVAFSAVVPCLQLDHVGLEGERLRDAVLEVALAAGVPVMPRMNTLFVS
jgi:hypothetical protein